MLGAASSMLGARRAAVVGGTLRSPLVRAPPTATETSPLNSVSRHRTCIPALHVPMQWLFLLGMIVSNGTVQVVVPSSFDFAISLGGSSVLSGLLVSLPYSLYFVGAMVARYSTRNLMSNPSSMVRAWRWVTFNACAAALCTLLYGCVAAATKLPAERRIAIACLARTCFGFSFGFTNSAVRLLLNHMLCATEQVALSVKKEAASVLGVASGPFVHGACGVIIDTLLHPHHRYMYTLVPSLVFAFLWLVWLSVFHLSRPAVEQFAEAMQHASVLCKATSTDPANEAGISKDERQEPPTRRAAEDQDQSDRKKLWTSAATVTFERAFLVGAVEVAAAYVLETEFHMSTTALSYLITGSIAVSIPILLLLLWYKNSVHPTMLLMGVGSTAMVASLLFFSSVTRPIEPYVGYWLYLLGDCTIYPLAFSSSGVMSGLAFKHAIPGTFYSAENYIVFVEAFAASSIGRLIAPPVARAMLHAGGRDLYAAMQMAGLAVSLMSVCRCVGIIRRLEAKESDM